MIYVDVNMFLRYTERYLEMAEHGTNVYILLKDGTELKLTEYSRR